MADQRQVADTLQEKSARSSREHHVRLLSLLACGVNWQANGRRGCKSAHIGTSHRTRDLLLFITNFSRGWLALHATRLGRSWSR